MNKSVKIALMVFLILLIGFANYFSFKMISNESKENNNNKVISNLKNENDENNTQNNDLNNNDSSNVSNENSNESETKTIVKDKDFTYTIEDKNEQLKKEKEESINDELDEYFEIDVNSTENTKPEKYISDISFFHGQSKIDEIEETTDTFFKFGNDYTNLDGIISFRGNNFRNAPVFGEVDILEAKLEPVWSKTISYVDTWTGVGWTGQPLIVKWTDEQKEQMNINSSKKSKSDLKEVIYATLDGNIYFLDIDDGNDTRNPIKVGYPFKGTPSLDPRGYPLLYAGQGIDKVNGESVPIGFRIFSLLNQEMIYFLDGRDSLSKRQWYAFDSSCIVDKENDIVYEPGENGIFYKMYLNTQYSDADISISPDIYRYRYDQLKTNNRVGIENSMVAYDHYGFFADNAGLIQCIDLNTLKPIWVNDLKEDIDASIVLDAIDENNVYLYIGTEVDFQGNLGDAYIRKINALNGEIVWEKKYLAASIPAVNGGCLATCAIDEQNVYFNIGKIDGSNRSLIVAVNKESGQDAWTFRQNNYCWSSPIIVHSKDGKKYLIQCDSIGQILMIDANSGELTDVIDLGTNIEGSPAVYDDMLVVGTRGQKIYGVKIK